jgi:hypothetical protein
MIFADTETASRTTAAPGDVGTCPTCSAPVISKCGSIVSWHWAHARGEDCDPWAEPMSAWHLSWQAHAPAERREVILGRHRADVVGPDGSVVEIQRSAISTDEIREREVFYAFFGPMTWIFDARDAYEDQRLDVRWPQTPRTPGYVTFRWKHPRKSLAACTARVLLDLGGEQLLRVGRIYSDAPCGGWGHILAAPTVARWISGADCEDRRSAHSATTRSPAVWRSS